MHLRTKIGILLGAVLLLVGCVEEKSSPTFATSAVALSVDILGASDVSGLRIAIDRVACEQETFSPYSEGRDVALEDTLLPDEPGYIGNPFAAESGHLFGDGFFWLAAGCYDVLVTPITAAGTESEDCTGAAVQAAQVLDGEVTEITLVLLCLGPGFGGLDVAGVLNHPPIIEVISYAPSKFVTLCEPVTICARASDPDGDPLEFVWSDGSTSVANVGPGELAESCIEVVSTVEGTEMISVTVYDLNSGVGDFVHLETLVSPELSRDSAELPLHIVWCDPTICCAPPPEPPTGCTHTQGYWKNHPRAWPLPLDTLLCGRTWMEILRDSPRGDAWLILAHQWIAASLNVASGASTPDEVDAALATPFILACVVNPADRAAALETAETLDQYNNGDIGPGHCDDCERPWFMQ